MARFSVDQIQTLNQAYRKNQFPSKSRCLELARQTGMCLNQVRTWFTRRRSLIRIKEIGLSREQSCGLLEAWNQYGSLPDRRTCLEIARKLDLNEGQVKSWFQGQRRRGLSTAQQQVILDDDQSQENVDQTLAHSESFEINEMKPGLKEMESNLKDESNENLQEITSPSLANNATVTISSSTESTTFASSKAAIFWPATEFFVRLNQSLDIQFRAICNTLDDHLQESSMKTQKSMNESQQICHTIQAENRKMFANFKQQLESLSRENTSQIKKENQKILKTMQTKLDTVDTSLARQQTRLDEISQVVGELREQVQSMQLNPTPAFWIQPFELMKDQTQVSTPRPAH